MGVLEDAIRQHLELKRQHGASDEELDRQEAEALGPARRGGAEPDADGGEPQAAAAGEEAELSVTVEPAADGQEAVAPVDEAAPVAEGASVDQEPAYETPVDQEPAHEAPPAEEPAPDPDAPHLDEHATELHADAPAAIDHRDDLVPSEPAEPHGDALLGDAPSVAFDDDEDPIDWDAPAPAPAQAEPAGAAETREDDDDAAEGDPLEETPDFLEDTPEHDRLWFEQRPPRDFDFD